MTLGELNGSAMVMSIEQKIEAESADSVASSNDGSFARSVSLLLKTSHEHTDLPASHEGNRHI